MHVPTPSQFASRPTTSLLPLSLFALLACAPSPAPEPDAPRPTQTGAEADGPSEPAPGCGGLAGTACPEGLTCVDDPSDGCDPAHGGADCLGVCTRADQPSTCAPAPGSGQRYVGHSPDDCARMRFVCEDGEQYFADGCGCGCEPTA